MLKKTIGMMALASLVVVPAAFAQEHKAEVSLNLGWAFSDGVSGTAIKALDGNTYDRIDPKDSFKWGLGVGIFVGENAEVGFLYGQQMSTLTAGGTTTKDIGDLKVNNYHGYFGYNFGASDATVRPYIFGGLGATNFSSVDYTRVNGVTGTIAGETQFSTTWGAGVKAYPSPNFGVRFGAQWTPTYIKTDSAGWWCDPWWGCYVVGNAQYSNQFELGGGVTFRF
jgi:hypothetical protein